MYIRVYGRYWHAGIIIRSIGLSIAGSLGQWGNQTRSNAILHVYTLLRKSREGESTLGVGAQSLSPTLPLNNIPISIAIGAYLQCSQVPGINS